VLARRASARSMWSTSESLRVTSNSRTRGPELIRRSSGACTPQLTIAPTSVANKNRMCYRYAHTGSIAEDLLGRSPPPLTDAQEFCCVPPKNGYHAQRGLSIYYQVTYLQSCFPHAGPPVTLPTLTSTGPTRQHSTLRNNHVPQRSQMVLNGSL
jgi:hypothetical protein